MSWQFWIDRGGTFTDIVARAPDNNLHIHKLLSENPRAYKDAAIQGIKEVLVSQGGGGLSEAEIDSVKMGTTVATNALLERKGERVLLVVNKGFRDILKIGYQNRPDLFALEIVKPEQLYENTVEISGRLDAEGLELEPLDRETIRSQLTEFYALGYRCVAIGLMHAYRNAKHEQVVKKIALDIGFTQVSTSSDVSGLIKIIGRTDTAVVDAYLSPILRHYVNQVKGELGSQSQLLFMQSHGGLVDADKFQGKDAILSGPAGGVVGMVQTAEPVGYGKLIGFDMGGTSTDVCHYAGELEREFETEVAGVRMRAPMMAIHTVAAGGGSILSFRQGRLQVGPESAGANPGPACYRNGGPLTVTDCNLLLGKIQVSEFPHVFGPNGDQSLDRDVVIRRFKELAQEIALETGEPELTPEELAAGFIRIAVDNMANAIKKISIEKGYDVSDYTLNCFGGAGGQHACLVADQLGIERIFIHPFAGVLSAFGMGLADIRVLKEEQVNQVFDNIENLTPIFQKLEALAQEGLADHSFEHQASIKTVYLKTMGGHISLPVSFADKNAMLAEFMDQHKSRFGYEPSNKNLVVDMLTFELVGQMPTPNVTTANEIARELANKDVYLDQSYRKTKLIDRAALTVGKPVNGPALIFEKTGTNVVELGWQAKILQDGNLILERYEPLLRQEAIGTKVDPIMLEVFNNLFMSIAEQMGVTLASTAYSVNIKERYDFSCAIFTSKGELVANAPHVPVHLGSMSEAVRVTLKQRGDTMGPGDVYMMNNPYNGGTHLPDVTVITPVFSDKGELIFFTASRGHHADIGGKTPGSAPPDSQHIEEEGVVIDDFLLVDGGVFQERATRELLASGKFPCRNIDENIADLGAQIAANEAGAAGLLKAVDQFGLDVVHAYMGHVQDNAEESVRRVLAVLKDGEFEYRLDSGATIKTKISVDQSARSAKIDFTGTSKQDRLNYNAPRAICNAVVLYVFRTLVQSQIPMNEGCLKPLEIVAPEGSMINPRYPAAVISGNTEVSQSIADCLYGALGVLGGSQGTMNNFVYGNAKYQNYETICGGAGAGDGFNGANAVHTHMTNTRMTDPEVLESRFPVRLNEFSIRSGSGGEGQWHGGDGIMRDLEFLDDMTVTTLSSHRIIAPHGAQGGEAGAVGENRLLRQSGQTVHLKGNDQIDVSPGDRFIMKTPGGGGFGKKDN